MKTVWQPTGMQSRYGHKVDEEKCRASVYSGGSFHWHQCDRKATVQEDGYGWCKQHAPSSKRKRLEKRNAKWKAEDEARRRVHKKRSAREKIATVAIAHFQKEARFEDLIAAFNEWDALP